jgi:DNA-binding transcriptional ArsR family regulator
MGATKHDFFTKQQNELAAAAKALSHPARIAIMQYLAKRNTCVCGDIVDKIPLAQPTVSQHLKELKNAGLIKGTVEGNAVCYCIDLKNMKKFQEVFNDLLEPNNVKPQCC